MSLGLYSFGGEASSFMLGGTLQHHYEQLDDPEVAHTLEMLNINTYVYNLMCTGTNVEDLKNSRPKQLVYLKMARLQFINGNQMWRNWKVRTWGIPVKYFGTYGTKEKTLCKSP